MYIFELIYKKIKEKQHKEAPQTIKFKPDDIEEELCEHIFLPIDSTKKILACSKCGLVIKTSDIPKKKNFFMH